MSRWFRVYDELLDDPKVQKLHPALFKVLINVWCVASRNEGRLPPTADLSFSLRMTEDETFRAVSKLAQAGLIDADSASGERRPHGWEGRQYRSDVSTDRVRAHRERQKSAKNPPPDGADGGERGNGDETFHETAPDTETEQIQSSDANASAQVVPHPASDFCGAVFDSGTALLVAAGGSEASARSFLGRLRKKLGDPEMLILIRQCESERPSDPRAWLTAAVETRNGNRQPVNLRGSRPDPSIDIIRNANAEIAAQCGDQAPDRDAWPALPSFGAG